MVAQINDLTNLAGLIQSISGSKTKQSQTSQTILTPEATNRLIADILSGPGGVGSIGSSAKNAGIYDSTTQDLMLSDLYSRTAARAALAGAPTVTNAATKTPGVGIEGIAIPLIASSAISSIMKGEIPFSGLTGTASKVKDLFGFGGEAASGAASGASAVTTGTVPLPASLVTGGDAGISAGTGVGSGFGAGISSGVESTLSSAGLAPEAASFMGTNAIPIAGSFLSGILGGKDEATSPLGIAGSAGAGFMAGGPVGAGAALLANFAGAYGGDILNGAKDLVGNLFGGIGKGAGNVIKGVGKALKHLF